MSEQTPTQAVFMGGRNRAIRNDNRQRYDRNTVKQASHKFSDEIIEDDVLPWIMQAAAAGKTPEEISIALWKNRRYKASPDAIRDKINVERTRNVIKPTYRVGKIAQPEKPAYDRYNFSPEAQAHIMRYFKDGWGASDIKKFLKELGHDVSFMILADYLNKLKSEQ